MRLTLTGQLGYIHRWSRHSMGPGPEHSFRRSRCNPDIAGGRWWKFSLKNPILAFSKQRETEMKFHLKVLLIHCFWLFGFKPINNVITFYTVFPGKVLANNICTLHNTLDKSSWHGCNINIWSWVSGSYVNVHKVKWGRPGSSAVKRSTRLWLFVAVQAMYTVFFLQPL